MLIQRPCAFQLCSQYQKRSLSSWPIGSEQSGTSLFLFSRSSVAWKTRSFLKITIQARHIHNDSRNRLSNFWAPTGGITDDGEKKDDAHSKLIKAGFIRQAHSGLYHLLPLGLRVQEKIEKLVDKHMSKLGASKVSLSTFSSEKLWKKSGRLTGDNPGLFRLEDRKGAKYLLSPTHEEEITTLVGDIVKSYKELPLRLYQITRKYRDEARPRQGLLRAREFLMKDLYTFDTTQSEALETYTEVRKAYTAFFDELKLPYLIAKADSGDIGGDLNHEFHFLSPSGEDNVISCDTCKYTANEEVAVCKRMTIYGAHKIGPLPRYRVTHHIREGCPINLRSEGFKVGEDLTSEIQTWYGVSSLHDKLYQAVLPRQLFYEGSADGIQEIGEVRINKHALKRLFPNADLGVELPVKAFLDRLVKVRLGKVKSQEQPQIETVFDYRIPEEISKLFIDSMGPMINQFELEDKSEAGRIAPDLVWIQSGAKCSSCDEGTLKVQMAVELGHTFHLGTRYTDPLEARVATNASVSILQDTTGNSREDKEQATLASKDSSTIAMQMGCHGIGISRMIAAVAEALADERGLSWPKVIAPFEAIVIPGKGFDQDALEVLDNLAGKDVPRQDTASSSGQARNIDVVLDDRPKAMSWKLKDADLIGYPVIVILGKAWGRERKCEVQCRRLGSLKEDVPLDGLHSFLGNLLAQL